MSASQRPFSVPTRLTSDFRQTLEYWQKLRRGENSMPFSDDVKLSSLPDLSGRLMLLDAFDNPQRLRFSLVGSQIRERYGADLVGKFIDEISPGVPFEFLAAQASVTVEAKAPTFFSDGAATTSRRNTYGRLLLPLWGDGRIGMILGAVGE